MKTETFDEYFKGKRYATILQQVLFFNQKLTEKKLINGFIMNFDPIDYIDL